MLDPQQPGSSGTHLPCMTDWDQCVLCQKDTSEKLCCPAESQRSNVGPGYQTLADNLLAFSKIGCLSKTIDLSKLDDGEDLQLTSVSFATDMRARGLCTRLPTLSLMPVSGNVP